MNISPHTIRPAAIALSIAVLPLSIAATGAAGESADEAEPVRYKLVEEWSIAAQGPVHLREKSVKETYQLDVTNAGDDADGNRQLQIRFAHVAVEAKIPAQRRAGSYDSDTPPEEVTVDDYEVIRPMALSGQTLELVFAPDGSLTEVKGTDAVTRRLDELYDKYLRGAEQDLFTRDFERERVTSEALCRSWADVFVVRDAERNETEQQRKAEAAFTACIPTESWLCRCTAPVTETVRFAPAASNESVTIKKTAILADSQMARGDIGGATWTWSPTELKRDTTIRFQPDGLVDNMSCTLTAVLATTLSIGNDIPIQMTIQHATELSRK
jgi:hypothetical protein